MHEHTFEEHVGIPVFGDTTRAWVPRKHVSGPLDDGLGGSCCVLPTMQRCTQCGEQGYEVPA